MSVDNLTQLNQLEMDCGFLGDSEVDSDEKMEERQSSPSTRSHKNNSSPSTTSVISMDTTDSLAANTNAISLDKEKETKEIDENDEHAVGRRNRIPVYPPREIIEGESWDVSEFREHKIIFRKISDPEQDKVCEKNKDYVFDLSAINHEPTDSIWIPLHDLLLGFGYPSGSELQSDATDAYLSALECYLAEEGSHHPTDKFYRRIRKKIYVSQEGFTLLVRILVEYEKHNNMLQHMHRYRFSYLREWYEQDLVENTEPMSKSLRICKFCCLEDLDSQFQVFCDCGQTDHLRCPAYEREDRDGVSFCPACRDLRPEEELLERRQLLDEGGEFEIERVLFYNNMRGEEYSSKEFPFGGYFVEWKGYPQECNQYIPFDESFLQLVENYWIEQMADPNGQPTERAEMQRLENHLGRPVKGYLSHTEHKRKLHEDMGYDSDGGHVANRRKRRKIVVIDTNRDCKYNPVKLEDIMEKDKILRVQELNDTAERLRAMKYEETVDLLADALKTGRREMGRRMQHWKGIVPNRYIENEMLEWKVEIPEHESQVHAHVERDWTGFEGLTKSCYELGEITDPENPANNCKRFEIPDSTKYGLFATKNIPRGTLLMEYTGLVMTGRESDFKYVTIEKEVQSMYLIELKGRDRKQNDYWPGPVSGVVIDPHQYHNESFYLNDYRDKVIGMKKDEIVSLADDGALYTRKKNVSLLEILIDGWPHVYVVSCEDISPGQELLTDYGKTYWDGVRRTLKRQAQIVELREIDEEERKQAWIQEHSQIVTEGREKRDVLRFVFQRIIDKFGGLPDYLSRHTDTIAKDVVEWWRPGGDDASPSDESNVDESKEKVDEESSEAPPRKKRRVGDFDSETVSEEANGMEVCEEDAVEKMDEGESEEELDGMEMDVDEVNKENVASGVNLGVEC